MNKAKGISLCFGKFGRKWRIYCGQLLSCSIRPRVGTGIMEIMSCGLRIDFVLGKIVRPFPKFWKKQFWSKDKSISCHYRPWNSGNHWFVLRLPPIPVLFLSGSILIGKYNPGGYIGFRTALVDAMTHQLANWSFNGEVDSWALDEKDNPIYAWGDKSENGNIYAEPTASLRLDMRH